FRVNTYTTGIQAEAALAIDANGDFVIAWSSFGEDDFVNRSYGVFAQRYNAAGVAQGGEFQVNSTTVGNQRSPFVALDGSGDFVIAWMSQGQDGSAYGVYAQRYTALTTVSAVYPATAAGVALAQPIAQNQRETDAIQKLVVTFTANLTATGPTGVTNNSNWQLTRNGTDISNQITGITFGFNATT